MQKKEGTPCIVGRDHCFVFWLSHLREGVVRKQRVLVHVVQLAVARRRSAAHEAGETHLQGFGGDEDVSVSFGVFILFLYQ